MHQEFDASSSRTGRLPQSLERVSPLLDVIQLVYRYCSQRLLIASVVIKLWS